MNVFLFVGAHDGTVVQKLDKLDTLSVYGKDNSWDKIYLMEPQPYHEESLKLLQDTDDRIIYLNVAASDTNGHANFYVKGGFGYCSSSLDEKKAGSYHSTISVDTINLSEWIFNNISKDDFFVVDMDIECGEYVVLPHLIESGAHNLIDFISVEFHRNKSSFWSVGEADRIIEEEARSFFKNKFLEHVKYFQ